MKLLLKFENPVSNPFIDPPHIDQYESKDALLANCPGTNEDDH